MFILTQLLFVSIAFGQADEDSRRNYLGFGPMIGYDGARETAIYGGVIEYEFKPLKRFGFTVAATYDFNPSHTYHMMLPDWNTGMMIDGPEYQLKQYYISAAAGARFYMKRFYVGAAAGYGYNAGDYYVPETNERFSLDFNRFYYQLSGGYLLPLKAGKQLDIGLFTSSGGSPESLGLPKIAVTAKYRFGF